MNTAIMRNKIGKLGRIGALRHLLQGAAAGCLVCTLVCGCDDFLAEEPMIAYTTETLFNDTLKLSMASLGCYEPLAHVETYGRDLTLADCGEDLVGSTDLDGSDQSTVPRLVGCYKIQVNSGAVYGAWKHFYRGVNSANTVINNSHDLLNNSSPKVRKAARKYVAEARVLRAFYYMDLVRRFGDIPIRTISTDISNHNSVASPRTDVYALIFKDLEEAVADLPWHDEDKSMSGRVTKGTALGLLIRAYMYAGGYSLQQDGIMKRPDNYLDYYRKAEMYSRELIASGKHALNPKYEDVFKKLCAKESDPKESMFVIDFGYSDTSGTDKEKRGCIGAKVIGTAIQGNSVDAYNASPELHSHYFAYKKFGNGDLRRDCSIATYSLHGDKFEQKKIDVKNSSSWGVAKWRKDWMPAPMEKIYAEMTYPMLRYSEVLLMRAELLNELNGAPTEEAIELVNQVRRRGYGLDINTFSSVADVPLRYRKSKEAFFDFLTEEYAREFLGESGRKFHLIRWNLLKKKLNEVGDFFDDPNNKPLHGLGCVDHGGYLSRRSFVPGMHELWPIPYEEIVNSDGYMKQTNPGYPQVM